MASFQVKPLTSNGISMVEFWLTKYCNVFPGDEHINALHVLTCEDISSVKAYLANRLRQGISERMTELPWDPDRQSNASLLNQDAMFPPIESNNAIPDFEISFVSPLAAQEGPRDRRSPMFDDLMNLDDTAQLPVAVTQQINESGQIPIHNAGQNIGESAGAPHHHSTKSSAGTHSARFDVDPDSSISAAKRAEILYNVARLSTVRDRSRHLSRHCQRTNDIAALEPDAQRRYQCTRKCGSHFDRKESWNRHEQIAYPVEGWICTIGDTILVDGERRCSYCIQETSDSPPAPHHATQAHGQSARRCSPTGRRDGVFTQKKHFLQHCRNIHPVIGNLELIASACHFTVQNSMFPRRCGKSGCNERFSSWNERRDHISEHFDKGEIDMLQWNDSPDYDNELGVAIGPPGGSGTGGSGANSLYGASGSSGGSASQSQSSRTSDQSNGSSYWSPSYSGRYHFAASRASESAQERSSGGASASDSETTGCCSSEQDDVSSMSSLSGDDEMIKFGDDIPAEAGRMASEIEDIDLQSTHDSVSLLYFGQHLEAIQEKCECLPDRTPLHERLPDLPTELEPKEWSQHLLGVGTWSLWPLEKRERARIHRDVYLFASWYAVLFALFATCMFLQLRLGAEASRRILLGTSTIVPLAMYFSPARGPDVLIFNIAVQMPFTMMLMLLTT